MYWKKKWVEEGLLNNKKKINKEKFVFEAISFLNIVYYWIKNFIGYIFDYCHRFL